VGKIGGGEEIAVVSDRNSGHAAARGFVEDLGHVTGAVEKREVRVKMKMNELRVAHELPFYQSTHSHALRLVYWQVEIFFSFSSRLITETAFFET